WSATWLEQVEVAHARRNEVHDAITLACRRLGKPYDQLGRALAKKRTADHPVLPLSIRPGQYPAIPGEVAGTSFALFDSNQALAIGRNHDAGDPIPLGGLDERPLNGTVAREARDGAVGQADCEAGAIGQGRHACSRERHTACTVVRRVGEPYGCSFLGDCDRVAVRRYGETGEPATGNLFAHPESNAAGLGAVARPAAHRLVRSLDDDPAAISGHADKRPAVLGERGPPRALAQPTDHRELGRTERRQRGAVGRQGDKSRIVAHAGLDAADERSHLAVEPYPATPLCGHEHLVFRSSRRSSEAVVFQPD